MIYFGFLNRGISMDILTKLNWVDILVIIVMLRTSYVAFQDGLSHEIPSLIGAYICLVFSLAYYKNIASSIYYNFAKIPIDLLNLTAFIFLFFVIGFIFRILKSILDKIVKVSWNPLIEKFGGLLAGIIKGGLVVSAILIVMVLTPLSYLKMSIMEKSLTGMYFLRIGPGVYSMVSGILPYSEMTGRPGSSEDIMRDLILPSDSKADNKKK